MSSDPGFSELDLSDPDYGSQEAENEEPIARAFDALSSGHKIVVLATARLIESVDERSLVLIDEPESHLHPPLLSSFIRALSDLLRQRNGVAIIATHSPVVLQEVPRKCVSILQRSGDILMVSRPEIETFGENVGVLTREVFGLEVTESGYQRLLADAAEREGYDEVVASFGGEIGAEGRAILRAIATSRNSG